MYYKLEMPFLNQCNCKEKCIIVWLKFQYKQPYGLHIISFDSYKIYMGSTNPYWFVRTNFTNIQWMISVQRFQIWYLFLSTYFHPFPRITCTPSVLLLSIILFSTSVHGLTKFTVGSQKISPRIWARILNKIEIS